MWKIWANLLLPKALKSCPKLKKLPNLVTLTVTKAKLNKMHRYIHKSIVYFPNIVVRPSTSILQTQFEALLDGKA